MDRLLELTRLAERSHFWFRGFRWFVGPHLARAAAGRPGLRLLDAGCGTGGNLPMLERWGRAYGFDLTWSGLTAARDSGNVRVARAGITAMPFADDTFDIIGSFDVLQCVSGEGNDVLGMREMARVLKPGGTILMNVAAFEGLRGAHSALSEEARRYTPSQLRRLVSDAGLRISTLTCTNSALVPLVWAMRAWQRWHEAGSPAPGELDIRVPPGPINAALTAVLWAEAQLQRIGPPLPVGSSILCVATKPER